MEMNYLKSADRHLNRIYVNRTALDLSKEALWVSVGQRATELPAIKVGGQKNFFRAARIEPAFPAQGQLAEFFFKPPTLMAVSFASL